MATEACPGSSCTNLGWTLLESKSVAQVCLRSWKRTWGRPAFLRSGAKLRYLRLEGLIGVPTFVVKTRPWSP